MTQKFTRPECAKAVFFLLAIAALAPKAQANLIVNGGFESGSSSWSSAGYTAIGSNPLEAHSGSHYAYFNAVDATAILSQSFTTTAGSGYDLSFWLQDIATSGTRTFEVSIDNFVSNLLSLSSGPSSYTQYNLSFTASSSTTLVFRGRNDSAAWLLDDVALNPASGGTNPAPEPATLALFALGAAGLRFSRKKPKPGSQVGRNKPA